MKLAVVATPSTLGFAGPSDYHMALAHLVRESAMYHNYYATRVEEGCEVILDNGAAEFGSSMHLDLLLPLVHMLKPTVWVMPDVVKNMVATLWHFNIGLTYKDLPMPFMAVPQGGDEGEWAECLEHMVHNVNRPPGMWLGISMFCLDYTTRGNLLSYVDYYRQKYADLGPVHLLGLHDPRELVDIKALYPWVHGIDTMKPISYGLEGVKLEDYRPGIHGDEKDPRVPGEMTGVLIRQNIQYLRSLTND